MYAGGGEGGGGLRRALESFSFLYIEEQKTEKKEEVKEEEKGRKGNMRREARKSDGIKGRSKRLKRRENK